jgi:hypothetical protein
VLVSSIFLDEIYFLERVLRGGTLQASYCFGFEEFPVNRRTSNFRRMVYIHFRDSSGRIIFAWANLVYDVLVSAKLCDIPFLVTMKQRCWRREHYLYSAGTWVESGYKYVFIRKPPMSEKLSDEVWRVFQIPKIFRRWRRGRKWQGGEY